MTGATTLGSGGGFTVLKAAIKAEFRRAEEHARQYHSQGSCWKGASREPCGAYAAYRVREMLEDPAAERSRSYCFSDGDETFLAECLSLEAGQELRQAMALETAEARLAVYTEAEAELQAEKKAEGKAFAREQYALLCGQGFGERAAGRIMSAAGPGRALEAVLWAHEARDVLAGRYVRKDYSGQPVQDVTDGERLGAATDALDCLLSGAGGTNGFGRERMEAALRALGLPLPGTSSSRALFSILRGAKEALLAGLPAGQDEAAAEEVA